MKKTITLLVIAFATLVVKAQHSDRFTFGTSIGVGIPMSSPAYTPFAWQVSGYYNFNRRFSAGIGTGLSVYEKTIIPLFAHTKFAIIKPRKFTPYLECGAGYGFAPGKNANGGLYLNPSIGVQYSIFRDKKLYIALGYELQKLERLRKLEHSLFTTEFSEKLSHNSISIKIGFIY